MSTDLTPPPVIATRRGQSLLPVAPTERIEILDVVRGFALFGILLVNAGLCGWPLYQTMMGAKAWTARPDIIADGFVRWFAEGKFYPLFSFLFGLGMSLQAARAAARGRDFSGLFCRRLLVLLGIGLAHAFLVWEGDILVCYAVCGFILLAFQNRKPKTLLVWAAVCLAIPVVLYALIWAFVAVCSLLPEAAKAIHQELDRQKAGSARLVEENIRVFSQGTLAEIFAVRARNVVCVWQCMMFYAPTVLGMFLLGIYVGNRGILQDTGSHRGFIRRALVWGLGLGLPAGAVYALSPGMGNVMDIRFSLVASMAALAVGGPALAFTYAAALALLAQDDRWKKRLQPLAAAGRMALTNYLLQSLVCTTIYYSYGLGLYGSVGRAAALGLTLAIFAAQVPLSVWWLKRFRFGPAEWVWRTLTYGKRQPMRGEVKRDA